MTLEETFPLDPSKIYFSTDVLTLDSDEGPITKSLGAWICDDPVRIHKMIIKEKILQVDQIEVFNPLLTKLRRKDPTYYKKIMGLQININFKGYATEIKAKIPFEDYPVEFYKWWRKEGNEDKVYLNAINQIRLFQKVAMMDRKILLKKDLEITLK